MLQLYVVVDVEYRGLLARLVRMDAQEVCPAVSIDVAVADVVVQVELIRPFLRCDHPRACRRCQVAVILN